MISVEDIYRKVAAGEITKEQAMTLLRQARSQKAKGQPAPPAPSPLSEGQRILWLISRLAPDNYAYNIPVALEIHPQTHLEALALALNDLMTRHPILGAGFGLEDEKPFFRQQHQKINLTRKDLHESDDLVAQVTAEGRKPFSLEDGPPVRATVFFPKQDGPVLLLAFHHIAFDGISLAVFLHGLHQCYQARFKGETPKLEPEAGSYAQFVSWQHQWLQGAHGEAARNYWLERLSPPLPPFALPLDKPRPTVPRFQGRSVYLKLDGELTSGLKKLAAKNRIPNFIFVMAVYKVLLKRLTQLDDVVIGTPFSGRPEARFEKTVGYFMNMMALRDDLSGNPTFLELARQVRKNAYDAMDHGNYPMSLLVGELRKSQPDLGQSLFQTAFYYQNMGLASDWEDKNPADDALAIRSLHEVHQDGEFDLTLEVQEGETALLFTFKYNSDVFEEASIERMAGHFQALIRSAVADVQQPIGQLNMLADAERQRLLVDWNNTETPYPQDRCIHQLVADQGVRIPHKRAVIFQETSLTYAQLDQKANRMAALLQEQGVGAGQLVGIFLDRSLDLVPSLLGVLKTGAAYVPFDPDYPADRISYMMEDSGVTAVVAQSDLQDRLPPTTVVLTDGPEPSTSWKDPQTPSHEPAYVIYTSGSTGKPKGVRIPHRALTNFLTGMAREPGMTEDDKLLALTTICFDIAGLELFLPLLVGAEVEVLATGVSRDGLRLKETLATSKPTVVQATPATWQMLLAAEWEQQTPLKVLCGGEALNPELADALTQQASEVWNMFGPTETTIWSSVSRVERGEKVTIGTPMANTWFFILDDHLQPVPAGVTGALYIGGDGLAMDYLNRPELTRERFIPNPFPGVGSERIYNTGDQARYLPDGRVEYLGRQDQQIKIRGFRIEIGEIETALKKLDNVREAVVVLRKDPNKRLVAFLIADNADQPLPSSPETLLDQWLPEYMIPSRFEQLSSFPMTLNRKVDRKTLGAEPLAKLAANHGGVVTKVQAPTAPQTALSGVLPLQAAVETRVAEIAGKLMDLDPAAMDRKTPIGQYGFDSLQFTSLSVKINKCYEVETNPTLFYEHPTLAGIAQHLAETWPQAMGEIHGHDLVGQSAAPVAGVGPQLAVSAAEPIAVIGLSARAPQSEDLDTFWENLMKGQPLTEEIPSERWDWKAFYGNGPNRSLVKWGGFVRDVDRFDSLFFGISPREAEAMDPQQRLLLETTWQAIENSGYNPEDLEGTATCVFMGVSSQDYQEVLHARAGEVDAMTATSNSPAILVNRISNILDLRGPSEPVNVACASALAAVHHAVNSLRSGETDMALAGGVNLILSPGSFLALSVSGMLSTRGICSPFAAGADGYVRGEGVGVLMLKPLSRAEADGDHIHGVIRGTATNHGGRVNSLTAPNPNAQADMLVKCYQRAGVDPTTVGYMEASANGTEMGDPLEITAMKKAFGRILKENGAEPPSQPWCSVGNVKSYIGHLEAASGAIGLVKVLLSMKHRTLPGHLYLDEINPYVDTKNSPFQLLRETTPWPVIEDASGGELPRRAGVSSFGFGGVNAHVILEAYQHEPATEGSGPWLFPLTAKDEPTLKAHVIRFRDFLQTDVTTTMEQCAHTLQTGRKHHGVRMFVQAANRDELLERLDGYLKDWAVEGVYAGEVPKQPAPAQDLEVRPGLADLELEKLGRQWLNGGALPWSQLYPSRPRRAVLPGCPFRDKRHWPGSDGMKPLPSHQVDAGVQPVAETPPEPLEEPADFVIDSRPAMVSWLTELMTDLLGLEGSLPADGYLGDYGFDSLTGSRLVNELEERFELSIPPSTLFDCDTVNALADYLAEALSLPLEAASPVPVEAPPSEGAEETGLPQTRGQMRIWMRDLIADLLKLNPSELPPDGYLGDYGFDSLTGARMTGELEDLFQISLPPSALFDCDTVNALADYLSESMDLPSESTASPTESIALPEEEAPGEAETALLPQTRGQMAVWLRNFIADLLKLPAAELPPDGYLGDYGFDSLTGARMTGELEELFGLALTPSALFDCDTVNALADYLSQNLDLPEGEALREEEIATDPQTREQMAVWLRNFIADLLKIPPAELPPDGYLGDYGFDSLTGARMTGELEERFGLTLTPSALFDCDTVNALVDYLSQNMNLVEEEPQVSAPKAPDAARPQTREEMAHWMRNLIAQILKLDPSELPPDGYLGDYGFDSLTGARMVGDLEEQFQTTITPSALYHCETVNALAQYMSTFLGFPDEASPAAPAIRLHQSDPNQPPTVFPLTEAQKAVWFLLQVDPNNYGYHLPVSINIRENLDIRVVKQAFELLVLHNPAFRTTFRMGPEAPEQVIHPEVRPFFEVQDIAHLEPEEVEPYIRNKAFRPFDLENGPLLRVSLFSRSREDHVLLFVIHHIIFDGSSFGLFITELSRAWRSLVEGEQYEPPPVQAHYSEFVTWQTQMLAGEQGAAQLKFWEEKLAGELPVLKLPADFPRRKNSDYSGAVHTIYLDLENLQGLQTLSRKLRVSPFMILLAAFKILLMRHTRQTDIIVGTPVAARPHERFENLIGFFINMVALRADLDGNPAFSQLVQDVKRTTLESLDHSDIPYATLIQKLGIDPSDEVSPIFQTAFNLQSWFQQTERDLKDYDHGLSVFGEHAAMGEMESIHETGAFDLTLEIIMGEQGAMAHFKYDPGLFKMARIAAMAEHYQNLLHAILQDPEQPVAYLNMMSPWEKEALLQVGEERKTPDITFTELIEKRVMERPDAPALIYDDWEGDGDSEPPVSYTYAEMNREVNRLAHYLIQQGVGPDHKVGVCLDRSAEMVIGVLAVMKAGGAYVPIDPGYPADRVAHILEQAQAKAVVTVEDHTLLLSAAACPLVYLDRNAEAIAQMSDQNPEAATQPHNLVYVTFTSGSTGKPKGVMIEHRRLVNVYHSWEEAYRLREAATCHLNMASFSFDVFSGDLARSLGSGATLVVCPKTFLLEPRKLYNLLRRRGVDAAEFVPAVLRNLIAYLKETGNDLSFFRLLIAGSDAWSVNEYADFKQFCHPETRLINSYGVTEATIDTTWFECQALGHARTLAQESVRPDEN